MASRPATTLKVVAWVTDWELHVSHPLVLAQTKLDPLVDGGAEIAKKAITPSVDLVKKLEELVACGETAQDRCLAGFFTCLAYSSSRASDVQESKNLHLAKDSMCGTSFLKNKKTWTK